MTGSGRGGAINLGMKQRGVAIVAAIAVVAAGGIVVGSNALRPSEAAREPVVLLNMLEDAIGVAENIIQSGDEYDSDY